MIGLPGQIILGVFLAALIWLGLMELWPNFGRPGFGPWGWAFSFHAFWPGRIAAGRGTAGAGAMRATAAVMAETEGGRHLT